MNCMSEPGYVEMWEEVCTHPEDVDDRSEEECLMGFPSGEEE